MIVEEFGKTYDIEAKYISKEEFNIKIHVIGLREPVFDENYPSSQEENATQIVRNFLLTEFETWVKNVKVKEVEAFVEPETETWEE